MKTAGVTRVVFDFLKYGTDQKFIYLNKTSSNRKTIKVSYKLKSILLFKKCSWKRIYFLSIIEKEEL